MEEVPKDVPEPRVKSVTITTLVNVSHALDKITRRLYIGYVIFFRRAPIVFHINQRSTIESSTFSSELIAIKTRTKHIIELRFKLKMFVVKN